MKNLIRSHYKTITLGVILLLLAGFAIQKTLLQPKVPAITLKTIDGQQFNLPQLAGRPLLINFWATTCVICVKGLPELIALYRELEPKGLQLISVAMAYDPPNRVVELAELRQIPYPVALDIDSTAADAFGDVQFTPSFFLISPQGEIVQQHVGPVDMQQLRESILAYL